MPDLGTPITFTLYDAEDAPIQTYSRARIPLVIAERAIELDKLSKDEKSPEKIMAAIYQLVIDFYGGKFSIDELKAGSDFIELLSVINAIAKRTAELMPNNPNPPKPGK